MAKAAEKLSRKEAPPDDLIAEKLRPITDGFEKHWRTVAIGAGAIFVSLAAGAVVLKLQSDRREDAAQAVGDALELVDRPVVAPDEAAPEGQNEAPTTNGKTAPKPPKAQVKATKADADSYPTEQAKQEAVAQKAKSTADQYGSDPAGRVALLTLADADYKLGKFPEAVETYNRFLTVMPEGDYLRAYGVLGLAYALLAEGKKDDALSVAQGLADHPPGNFGKDLGLLAVGRIAEDEGKLDAAKQAYRRLRSEMPETAAGRDASARLTYLGEPPPPPVLSTGPAAGPGPAPMLNAPSSP